MEEQEVVEEIQEEAPPEVAPEIIQEAIDTGWQPEEQFKGDKSKWRPADEWVERGRNLIPIIKSQVKDYKGKIDYLESQLESQKKTTERILKMNENNSKRAYEQAKRKLSAKQMEAVKDGDTEKWARLKEEEDKLEPPEQVQPEQPSESPVFTTWKGSNTWYGQDSDMSLFADSYGKTLENSGKTYEQILSEVETKVKEVFPHKFENPARNAPPAVESPSVSAPSPAKNKNTYAGLPADAKKMCNQDVGDGLYKSKEDWVKAYYEEE